MNRILSVSALTEVTRTTFRDHIAESLRANILSGELPPGTPLVEGKLAQQFGVSRGPLREAMRQLTEEGLLTTRAYTATYVTQLTEKDIRDIYSLRTALEIFAFEQCWPLRDETFFAEIRAREARLTRAIDKDDGREAILAELALHSTAYEWSGNDQLLAVWGGMRGRIQLYWATHQLAHRRRGPRRDAHEQYVELACGKSLPAMVTEIRTHMRLGEEVTAAFVRDAAASKAAAEAAAVPAKKANATPQPRRPADAAVNLSHSHQQRT